MKLKLSAIGWVVVFVGVFFFPWLANRLQPKIIIKEIPVIVEVEKIVEVPVFKGEKIVEKFTASPIGSFAIKLVSQTISGSVETSLYEIGIIETVLSARMLPQQTHGTILIELKRRYPSVSSAQQQI